MLTKHDYNCTLKGKIIPMNDEAISAAQDDCEKPVRRRRKILLSALLPSLAFIFIAIFITILVRSQRRKQYYHHLNDRVNKILENMTECRFSVFLSYSTSEDSEFTKRHVLQPLQVNDSSVVLEAGKFRKMSCYSKS